MRGDVPWDEDPEVADNIVVCPFMKQSSLNSPNFRPCHKGYKLHIGDNNFQLYNRQIRDTFVFITRPAAASGADVVTSIALQKISSAVQKVGQSFLGFGAM
jgi:regulator of nonsense transcripts 1